MPMVPKVSSTVKARDEHRAALMRMIESGPIPGVHGVARWRLVDLCQWVFEEFRVHVAPRTMGRELHAMGHRKLSARPRHFMPRPKERSRILKNFPCSPGGRHAGERCRSRQEDETKSATRTSSRGAGRGEARIFGANRSTHGLNLYLCRHLPMRGHGRSSRPALLQHRGDELTSC
jgi:hypothetical protein